MIQFDVRICFFRWVGTCFSTTFSQVMRPLLSSRQWHASTIAVCPMCTTVGIWRRRQKLSCYMDPFEWIQKMQLLFGWFQRFCCNERNNCGYLFIRVWLFDRQRLTYFHRTLFQLPVCMVCHSSLESQGNSLCSGLVLKDNWIPGNWCGCLLRTWWELWFCISMCFFLQRYK